MDLRGSLHATDLTILVRFLAGLGTSGRLRVSSGEQSGDLYLEGGRITAARFGGARGFAALDAVAVELRHGQFTFRNGELPDERELDVTPSELQARLATLDPSAAAPVRTSPPPGAAAAGAGAAARAVREQLRQLPEEAERAPTASAPAASPERRAATSGRTSRRDSRGAVLVALAALGAVAGGVVLASQLGGGAVPRRSDAGRLPVVPAVSTVASAGPTGAARNPSGAAPATPPALVGSGSVAPTAAAPTAAAPSVAPRVVTPSLPAASPAASEVAGTRVPGGGQTVSVPERVAAAEADLRSGRFEISVGISATSRSSATLWFDLGAAAGGTGAPRLRMTSTYVGPAGTQTTDQIVVGEGAWDRGQDGRWVPVSSHHSPWHQVQGLLPRAASAADVTGGPDVTELRWYDSGYGADVTLRVDTASGIPRELRRVTRATGIVLNVAYTGWNVPVEVTPPQI
jgi:hypothetical protein